MSSVDSSAAGALTQIQPDIVRIADVEMALFGLHTFATQTDQIMLERFIITEPKECAIRPQLIVSLGQQNNTGFSMHHGIRVYSAESQLLEYARNPVHYATINDELDTIAIYVNNEETAAISELLAFSLCTCLARHGVLMWHASLVDIDGEGVMFVGKSGIGKTTQAEIWKQYLNASIVNGDHCFVRTCDGVPYGYGSPWHGSSPYCQNRRTHLKAIVALEQSDKNRLVRLDPVEAVIQANANVYLPVWNQSSTVHALSALDEMLSQMPFYLLQNKADKEAARLMFDAVFN